jgi:hypothetical protein
MTVKNSTQQLNRWQFDDNPTELSTETYPDAIVEDSILNSVRRNLFKMEEKPSIQFSLNEKKMEFNKEFSLGVVKDFYGFKNSGYYSKKTQRWVGHVIAIEKDKFFSRLDDLTNPGTYEIAELDISDVSPDDFKLLQKGAIFYWSIGETMNNGQLKKESIIRFKRESQWTDHEIDSIEERTKEMMKNLVWD